MVRYGGGIDAPDIGDDGGGSDGGGDGDGGGGDGGGGGGVDVDFGGGGIDAPNIGDGGGGDGSQAGGGIDAPDPGGQDPGGGGTDAGGGIDAPDPGGVNGGTGDGSDAGGGIDAPDPGGEDPGGGGTDAGGGIDAPDPGGEDPGGGGTDAGGGIDAPDPGGEDIPPPSDGQPEPPSPGDVRDFPTGDDRAQPPGAGPETIGDPEPVQGIETVTGAGGDVGRAFRGRAIEQQVLEENPNLSAEDVRITPGGMAVLTTTGEELFAEQARQDQREAFAGLGFEGVGTDRMRAPTAPGQETGVEQRGVEGGDIELAREAAQQRGIEGGDVRLFGEAAQQARDAEVEAARREIGPDGGPTFTLPGLNIEAQAGDLGMGQQAADFRPTQDFERQDLGDEFIQGTIPGPFEFGGLNGGGAVIDFPGAGREIEPFLGEEARAFSTFAEEVGTGVEEAIPIPGLGGATGQTARGFTELFNPGGLALTGVETAETGAFLAGGLPGVGEGDFGERAGAVGGQAAPSAVQAGEFAQENPFQTTGMLLGGAAGGLAAGRAVESLPNLARAGRIRAQGGDIFDLEDLSDPPETTMGELPRFTESAVADPDVAVREFRTRAESGALAERLDQPAVFSGRAGEDVAEFGGFGRSFDAPEGGAEIPGMFFAADLSPLRLPGSTSGGPSVPRPGLPRPRVRQARVAAEVDPEVQRMPGDVRTLDEAGTFMRTEADPEGLFVRSEQLITPEQEAIAPPGAAFETFTPGASRLGSRDVFGRPMRSDLGVDIADEPMTSASVFGRPLRTDPGVDIASEPITESQVFGRPLAADVDQPGFTELGRTLSPSPTAPSTTRDVFGRPLSMDVGARSPAERAIAELSGRDSPPTTSAGVFGRPLTQQFDMGPPGAADRAPIGTQDVFGRPLAPDIGQPGFTEAAADLSPAPTEPMTSASVFGRPLRTDPGVDIASEPMRSSEVFGRPMSQQFDMGPPSGGGVFGIRVGGTGVPLTDRTVGGEIVTGRAFQRVEADPDAEPRFAPEPGEVAVVDALEESGEAMTTIRRVQQRDRDPTAPGVPTTPTATPASTATDFFGFETPTAAPTTPTELFGTTEPTLTQPTTDMDPTAPSEATAPSSPTSVSSPFGSVPVSSGAPSAPPTQPTSAPPSEPPSSPPSAPPSAPPSGPPPSGPPSGPPSEPPTIPGMPPTGPPPSRPPTFFDPDPEPVSRDEPERRPLPPEGQQFENPIASGFQFLFGRGMDDAGTASPFGDMQSPFGDLGGE